MTPVLYSLEDTAVLLGVSKRTVQRRVTDGSIRVVRLGPRRGQRSIPRVSQREIDRLIRVGTK